MKKLQVKAGLFLSFFLCMKAGFCVNAQESVFDKDGGVYLIQSAQDMRTLALLVNGNKEVEPGVPAHNASYRLTRDIDLSPYCTGEEGWEPIGYRDVENESLRDILWELDEDTGERVETNAGYFNGTFDGANHVVTGLYINRPEEYGQGLFGQRRDLMKEDSDSAAYTSRENTVIGNLYIKECDITGKTAGGVMQGMICWGFENNGNLYIENCHVTGKIMGTVGAGGIVCDASSVKNSSFKGTVKAEGAGGIAAHAYYIYGCTVNAVVDGSGAAGGIARSSWCVRNSYMTGSVKGYENVGGIVGLGACLTGCYTRADVTGYSHVGGLIGNILIEDMESLLAVMPEGASVTATIQNCLMGGSRIERAQKKPDSRYKYGNNGYIYGFASGDVSDLYKRAYYREGLETEGFASGIYDFADWNCKPCDCTHLEETDFQELLGRPEEEWSDVWYCAADYAWPIFAWEKNSRFGYTLTVTVQEGDSLWNLADKVYGDGYFWTQIYEQNKELIGGDANLIEPGMDLEIMVNASQADYAAKGDIWEQEKEFLAEGRKRGIARAELKDAYRRLLADDLWNGVVWRWEGASEDSPRQISDWVIGDLDGNGQTDMVVMAGEGSLFVPGEIWLYFNEEPPYILKDETAYYEDYFCFGSSFWEEPFMVDLDNDGNLELLFAVGNGGNGGPGGRNNCLFRRVGNEWVECLEELPNDYGERGGADTGLWVYVKCIGVNRYEAYCPYLDERIEFDGRNSREIGENEYGRNGGANVRGFFDFECVTYQGKNALHCREYLSGEGGNAHGVGEAVFILVWDDNGVCRVADWRVDPYH